MSDAADQLIPNAQTFLAELVQNNNRDWFKDHQGRYDQLLRHPAEALLRAVSEYLGPHHPGITGKLFRPQRDLRFGTDKTPYHTHLHLLWSLPATPGAGLYFAVTATRVTLGGGVMQFSRDQLPRWRAAIAGQPMTRSYPTGGLDPVAGHSPASDSGLADELAALLDILALKGLQPKPAELKRVPAPHGAGHPHADLLRRKSLTLWQPLDGAPQMTPMGAVCSAALMLEPLFTLLRPILTDTCSD
ncbi:DUF2461 domain-containing protein [Phaeobacter porticola]|uniref:TIGR02453 family protein n=1 Tax=Phaeobacter porticola TaxID=1844006 RepID=A0A1L3I5V5_9RHOB|nr:DUF2461 domain-containing protein [Phaeobacter porticola]APG47496.1 hypothetical protein PhaeoP97_02096 [Phaeobacter porticola]